jgi:hypothetical protein
LHVVHAWRLIPAPTPCPPWPSLSRGAHKSCSRRTQRVSRARARVAEAHLPMGSPIDAVLDVAEEVGDGS